MARHGAANASHWPASGSVGFYRHFSSTTNWRPRRWSALRGGEERQSRCTTLDDLGRSRYCCRRQVPSPDHSTAPKRPTSTVTAWFNGPCPPPNPGAEAIAARTYTLALSTASRNDIPCANPAATADAVVHPVPWVCRVWIRGDENASVPSGVA